VGRLSRLQGLYLFLAALWCGALVAFAGGAGVVLRASPTRASGGAVNRALLDAVDESSYIAIALLFILFFAVERASPLPRLPRALTVRLLVVAAAATIVSHLLVTPEMVSLRERAGAAFDALPRTDPVLRDWGRLHAISVLALLVRIGCAAGIFWLGLRGMRPQPLFAAPPAHS
jgi:hypothetical protein